MPIWTPLPDVQVINRDSTDHGRRFFRLIMLKVPEGAAGSPSAVLQNVTLSSCEVSLFNKNKDVRSVNTVNWSFSQKSQHRYDSKNESSFGSSLALENTFSGI
ncbi:hypothetical protein F0562_017776 [Nyssa sinensis]|uniref:Uncharacterized protein n=1 Tax=Nyssa sinensis TaxID=561372 RepID=A0A5J4ZFP8_9ASTE|nr:hypothetical protein F0562_017776 [Nyssa sinensis]